MIHWNVHLTLGSSERAEVEALAAAENRKVGPTIVHLIRLGRAVLAERETAWKGGRT